MASSAGETMMRLRLAPTALFAAILLSFGVARAQGIDCGRARSTTEKAICASPALLSLDHQVAIAYGDALARKPDARDAMRADLLRWLRQRDTACNVPAAALERCLSTQLTARLVALAPPTPVAVAPPAQPVPQATLPVPAAFPDPPIPPASDAPPSPAASVEAATLPAAPEADTLLHVTSPGRFTIAAHSASGAALQLVDMLTGPSAVAGAAGGQDGRLDQLLDTGTYKLRVFSAPGATGNVALAVTPFHDAAPPAALPQPGHPLSATLKDSEQRAFWLLVPPRDGPNVRIEAAGRALGDLRLWQNGRDMTALEPVRQRVEPAPGHPLDDLRLVGHVEPGTYLVVAYGGPAAPWTDGAADQPFHLRSGTSDALGEGWAGGTVGPFGSEVFAVPPAARILRLDLPAAAPAELRLGADAASIEKASREPTARLDRPAGRGDVVEVRGASGQPYTLRALDNATVRSVTRPGNWWVSAVTTGMGGDEMPPSLLLQRSDKRDQPLRIVASTAPRIGPGAAWHGRFNLRGPTDLLFQLSAGGDVGFSSTGVPVLHRRGQFPNQPPDFYDLTLEPQAGALGAVDLVVGPPRPPPPLARALPSDPIIPFGVQTLSPGQALQLESGAAPSATAGLAVRPVPVALVEGPLLATVAAGNTLAVPVQIAPGGSLVVSELGVGPIAIGQQDAGQPGRTTVVIPVADRPRTVALAWRRTEAAPPPIPPPAAQSQVAAVAAGTPAFFDLRRGEERGFALTVPEGGLFRVETLGRLHTAARLATPFLPRLSAAEGNGVGQNMLIQSALRAGRYRVDVRAIDSAGHLGLAANPAPLLAGGTLLAGSSVRATLPAGSGVAFPVRITGAADDRYHLDVLSLGRAWTGRLEDAEGWPVVTPGPLDGLETALRPGTYRLVVTPDSVGRQVVARMRVLVKPVEIAGHGPHKLPFDAPQHATWREPDGKDRPRDPDVWTFGLAGPAEVTLKLADGMQADLHGPGTTARIVGSWTQTLPAGDYRLEATSLGRNDRLDYTVSLRSPALQPRTPRSVTLPASVPFSIGADRVASLTSWGAAPVKAVLRREDGSVVARYGPRADDWNIAASRLLQAGRYTLDLQSAAPPSLTTVSAPTSGSADAGDAPDDDDQDTQTAATQGATPPKTAPAPDAPAADSDSADASNSDGSDTDTAPRVELRLDLPAALPAKPAPLEAAALEGDGVHVLTLPQPAAGGLLVAQARSSTTAVLALERQDGAVWRTVAIDSGTTPTVAALADAAPAPWRLEAWSVDAGIDPIRLAARTVTVAGQAPGQVSLAALEGMPAPLSVGRLRLDTPGVVSLGASAGLLAAGWPGHAATPAQSSIVAMGADVWLISQQPAAVTAAPLSLPPGGEMSLAVTPGLSAALPALAAANGQLPLWRVESGSGQPDLGLGAGVAPGSAVALGTAPVTLRSDAAARLRVTHSAATMAAAMMVDSATSVLVPAGGAIPVTLPPGNKTVQLDLGPNVAAFAGWHEATPVGVWGGMGAVSRVLAGAWTDIVLVNLGHEPAPSRVAVQPGPDAITLRPGAVVKRFFGAAGSFDLPFDAPAGARLMTAGDTTLTAVTAAGIGRGSATPVNGPGRAIVQHGPGALAVWLDVAGRSPWPDAAVQAVSLPVRLPLSNPVMALGFTADTPMLLHVSTTAPALAAVQQGSQAETPTLFAAGTELHRVVAAGPVTVRLFSADDGPLSGTASIWAERLVSAKEGLGDVVAVAPGGAAAFGFTLAKAMTIGLGIRAEPDRVTARLLDAAGKQVGAGVAQLRTLPAGDYVLEAQVPADASPTLVRPALVGLTPRPNGPPPDVVQSYLELVGMKPQGTP